MLADLELFDTSSYVRESLLDQIWFEIFLGDFCFLGLSSLCKVLMDFFSMVGEFLQKFTKIRTSSGKILRSSSRGFFKKIISHLLKVFNTFFSTDG